MSLVSKNHDLITNLNCLDFNQQPWYCHVIKTCEIHTFNLEIMTSLLSDDSCNTITLCCLAMTHVALETFLF